MLTFIFMGTLESIYLIVCAFKFESLSPLPHFILAVQILTDWVGGEK